MAQSIVAMLSGGDRRSLGRANEAAALATKRRAVFAQLMKAIWHEDPIVRMRAADAAEKVSREHPDWLAPYKAELLGLLNEETQQEVRWHLLQMLTRLPLTREECRAAIAIVQTYLEDRGSIVKTFAMQTLADLAMQDASLRPDVLNTIRELTKKGTPAMRARGRHLLKRLESA